MARLLAFRPPFPMRSGSLTDLCRLVKTHEAYVMASPLKNVLPANLSGLSWARVPLKLHHHKQQQMVKRLKHQIPHERPAVRKHFAARGQGGS